MHIVIVNAILYTAETRQIPRVSLIKDTMIYALCMGFYRVGHRVTLVAAADYRPIVQEEYPFEVVFLETACHSVCMPHRIPYMPGLGKYLDGIIDSVDFIISSEVFSLATYTIARRYSDKLIIWQELAAHNRMMHELPSRIWYSLVARHAFRQCLIVPRSENARLFIRQFCNQVSDTTIDHGVGLEEFPETRRKENQFIICSQLIARKQIDGILRAFAEYLHRVDADARLLIAGDGEERMALEGLARELHLETQVRFYGRLDHANMIPLLASSMALLVNTRQDNNMVSIVESLAVCTPVVTTDVPYNAAYIRAAHLGVVRDHWDWRDLQEIRDHNAEYVAACEAYRPTLSVEYKVQQFLSVYEQELLSLNVQDDH